MLGVCSQKKIIFVVFHGRYFVLLGFNYQKMSARKLLPQNYRTQPEKIKGEKVRYLQDFYLPVINFLLLSQTNVDLCII